MRICKTMSEEAFCCVMRKWRGGGRLRWGKRGKKKKRRHVCMQMLVRVFLFLFFFLFLFRRRWLLLPLPVEEEAGARQNPSPGVERRRDGLAAPNVQHWRILSSLVAFIPFEEQCKECLLTFWVFCFFWGLFFNFIFSESRNVRLPGWANISGAGGQIGKKGTPLTTTSTPTSFPLLLFCAGEPMVHYNWPLSSCR